MTDRLLSVDEAAQMLGATRGTIYQWAYQGRIPKVKLFGKGSLRFRESSLKKLIEKYEIPAREKKSA